MENKRIGFEGKRALHNFRGLGNYSRGVIEGLVKYYPNNEYFLFSPAPRDQRAHDWLKSLPQLKLITPKAIGALAPSIWRSLCLGPIVQKYQLDLFHGLSHELPPFGLNCAQVVTIHDLIYLRYPEFFPAIDRMVYDRKFRRACTLATRVLAICEQTKKDLVTYFKLDPAKIDIAYQSVSSRYLTQHTSDEILARKIKYELKRPYFFSVGALEERKNVLNLLRSFISIANEVAHDLVLVGKGAPEYERQLRQLVADHHLGSRVHFLRSVPDSDLPALYQGAEVMCFPSFFEGFGLPIVEALLSRTPVITSQGSCFPESGGPHSWYIDPHDVGDLALAMKTLAFDSDRRELMAREGEIYARQFLSEQTSQNMARLYQKAILR